MKLAFITQDFPPEFGGIQTYSLEIARRIHAMCDRFVLVAPAKQGDGQIDRELPFEVIRIHCPNTLLGPAAIPRILPVFRKYGIEATLHAQWQSMLLSVAARKAGIVQVATAAAHAREFFYNPYGEHSLPGRMYERYKRYLMGHVDHFFPVSRYTAGILQEYGIPEDAMDVVINGTNPELFKPGDPAPLKKKYGLEGKKVLLTITRLINRKAVDTVLRAVALLVKRFPDIQYVVVGEGPFEQELRKLTRELGLNEFVRFAGRVPYEKVSEYYNMSDVYVMPSKTVLPEIEAFGIVFLEANACGVPAVGSNTGGIPDAIVDGETGLLVEEQNPEELAAAVRKLLEDDALRLRMGRNGRRRVEEVANWDTVSARLYELILNTLRASLN